MAQRILITGASGTIGSALHTELRSRGADVTLMRSRPGQAEDGRHVVADFNDPGSLRAAFEGHDTVFLLFSLNPDMLTQARNAVQAARDAGVRHLVRSSGAGADTTSPYALAREQGRIDETVQAAGLAWTLLRPNFFMQNHLSFNRDAIRSGTWHAAHGQGATAVIDVQDIARVAATVLLDPAAHAGQTYTLTGPEALTDAQQMAVIAEAIGRPVQHVDVPDEAARAAMASMGLPAVVIDWLDSLNQVVRAGHAGGLTDTVQALTGRAPTRFADFVARHRAAWA